MANRCHRHFGAGICWCVQPCGNIHQQGIIAIKPRCVIRCFGAIKVAIQKRTFDTCVIFNLCRAKCWGQSKHEHGHAQAVTSLCRCYPWFGVIVEEYHEYMAHRLT